MMAVVLGLGLTGLVVLAIGVAVNWARFRAARGLGRLLALGRPLEGAALAAFGAEHLFGAQLVIGAVPRWMPWPLFWAYLVGVALVATGLSIVCGRLVRWSATMAGGMVLLFVAMVHLPNAFAAPGDRVIWTVAMRDLAFAGGLWALAGSWVGEPGRRRPWMVLFGRVTVAAAALVFGIEHILRPAFTPGIPLGKVTPAFMPWPHVWAAGTGLLLLACGAAMLVNRYARTAAAVAGLWEVVLTLGMYVPMLALAAPGGGKIEGLNYVWDTLLFAGTLLLVAGAVEAPAARLAVVQRNAA